MLATLSRKGRGKKDVEARHDVEGIVVPASSLSRIARRTRA
jgi:hypothetical protein